MNKQQKIQEITLKMLELIHNCYYEDGLQKEYKEYKENQEDIFPITIGRLMQAIKGMAKYTTFLIVSDYIKDSDCEFKNEDCVVQVNTNGEDFLWKLTKENGQECTLEDQSEETIDVIYKLLFE